MTTQSTKDPLPNATENPLDESTVKDLPVTLYTEKDRSYLSFLQVRLQNARDQKMAPMPEFNGRNYYQWYEENEKIANTYIEAKKNDDDVIINSGTVESKLDAILSAIANLDLSVDIYAYDKDNNEVQDLGNSMVDIIRESEEMDGADGAGDEEKKVLRQRELLKQGTVFVQDEWVTRFERKKKLKKKYGGEFKFEDGWDEAIEKVFEGASRTLLYGPNVYLGNLTKFFMDDQPYAFVAIKYDYEVAKTIYGKFANWDYVKKGEIELTSEAQTLYDNKWRLNKVTENQVEVIIYQDEKSDEFQIIANGVLLLPIGFPLSAVAPNGKFNIVKQVLRPFGDKFAYGKPFTAFGGIKEISALIDELLKLFVLKTRKSITPAYINTSGRVIPKKVLSPGRITMGIPPDALHAIGQEGQGVTNNEFAVLKELQDRIDKNTISPQFQGQQSKTNTTATEIDYMREQAKLTLGLVVGACMFLEKKLGYLRLWILLENWFNPTETIVDDAREKIVGKYRTTNRSANIFDKGPGRRIVVPMGGELPKPAVVRTLERSMEKKNGFPVQYIFLDPEGLKKAKLTWYLIITPREKESSSYNKLQFRDMLTDMVSMINIGASPNVQGMQDQYARAYKTKTEKVFSPKQTQVPPAGSPALPGGPAQPGGGDSADQQIKMPPSTPGNPSVPVGAGRSKVQK